MKNLPAAFVSRLPQVRFLPWIALFAIILTYLCLVVHLHPTNFFGLSEDDTLYFSSAKAMAEGQGYILPSVPGTPPATKYPILYPWILSWVWRCNPAFPENLSAAVAVNLVFGLVYLIAVFTFLRKLPGSSNAVSLVLTAGCALNPRVLFFSANLMSDIPFAALALGACVFAGGASEKEARPRMTVLCGLLTGLSILIRALGIPIAAGLFVAMGLRSGWRKAAIYATCVLPLVAVPLSRSLLLAAKVPLVAASTCSGSWRTTWLYYTSYAGFWRADVLSHGVFWQTVRDDVLAALVQPAVYLVKPAYIAAPVLALVLFVILSVVAFRGGVRLLSSGGWLPIHIALAFYLLPILMWNYGVMDRFLLPFLPLIFAGIWWEVRHLVSQVRSASGGKRRAEMAVVACFFGIAAIAMLAGIGASWSREIRAIAKESESRAALLVEKREAYAWLRKNSSQDAVSIAYEDASLFLYSGRQAIRPVIFSTAGVKRPDVLNSELACILSNANIVHAKYWLVSDDDFDSEWEAAKLRAKAKEQEMERSLSPVFRSGQDKVRIYELDENGSRGASRPIGE
jgi:4-amino-4-deoxy-L-arabinose transferase-like glycosyltransferase